MNRWMASASLVVLCLACELGRFGYVGRAQNFTAELGTMKTGSESKETLGRAYVSHRKIRIETRELSDGFFLVDADQPAAWFIRPRQRLFMDAKRSTPLTQVFVRVDPNDACKQWQAMERIAGSTGTPEEWQCELLGPDVVDGRDTLKYRVVSRGNRRSYRWIDPLRQFPVRMEDADGTVVTLERFVDAPQPSTLFAVPAGYRKFDPLQLIERIKQSDVWVEPRR